MSAVATFLLLISFANLTGFRSDADVVLRCSVRDFRQNPDGYHRAVSRYTRACVDCQSSRISGVAVRILSEYFAT